MSVSRVVSTAGLITNKLPNGAVIVEVDSVPTIDDDEPVASYREWRPEDTKVVTYCYGSTGALYKHGTQVKDKAEAVRLVTEKYGKVLEANHTPGRSFFRVFKERK